MKDKKMEIEIYNLKNKEVRIEPIYQEFVLEGELGEFARRTWEENYKGWSSSYIPNVSGLKFTESELVIKAGFTRYSDQIGIVEAIRKGKSFAPRGVNGLSVSTYVVTADKKIILPRRSSQIKHAPLVYNVPSGWMSSMNIVGREQCENPELVRDPRLYDPKWQVVKEFKEEICLSGDEVLFLLDKPLSLIRGWDVSFNLDLSYSARIKKLAKEVVERALKGQEEFAEGRKEHDKIAAVPIENLEILLRNQPQLQEEDPKVFKPTDTTELILVDHTIGGLVDNFELLTGREKPKDLIDHLGKGSIEIIYKSTIPGVYLLH